MPNELYVFREQNYFFGILPDDFDTFFPLNRVTITPVESSASLWIYEEKKTGEKGFFIHPASFLGFRKLTFSQSSLIFLINRQESRPLGMLMNEFIVNIALKKAFNKNIEIEAVKNFPKSFPKSVFNYIHRYKRANVFVINPTKMMEEFNIRVPESIECAPE